VSKRQWQSGKPVKGEHSCRAFWDHIRRTNQDFAHKTARTIARYEVSIQDVYSSLSDYASCELVKAANHGDFLKTLTNAYKGSTLLSKEHLFW
jgi:hypothetical protein